MLGFLFNRPILWATVAGSVLLADHFEVLDDFIDHFRPSEAQAATLSRDAYEADLIAAQTEAQRYLPRYLAQALRPGTPWETRAVLVDVTLSDATERLWVEGFRPGTGTSFVGQLTNQPQILTVLGQGDEVTFPMEAIVDWSFVEAGTGFGYFTVHASLPFLPPAQASITRGFLHDRPLPEGW